MHISRLSRSERSRSETPPQTDSSNVGAPAAKHSLHIPKILRFARSRSQAPPPAHSSSAIDVASPATSRQGMNAAVGTPKKHSSASAHHSLVRGGPVAAHQDIPDTSARPSSHTSQPVTSLTGLRTRRKHDPYSSATPPAMHPPSASKTADFDLQQCQDLSHVPQPLPAMVSQQLLISPKAAIPRDQHSPLTRDGNSYEPHIQRTHESRDVAIDGNNNNVNYTNTVVNNKNNFMAELLQETIPGAAFDSSVRDPPPRCHPGTRLAVIARCLEFISKAATEKKMLWVVGQAGVGKSAIMQNVAESPLPSVSERASIFLSINGRNDGAKIIITLVYQLAEQCEPYRQCVEHEITRHPSLLQSSMSAQFQKLLVEPFIDTLLSSSVGRILIIVDGLDECNNLRSQVELLRLISDVCSTEQSSPLVWIIASRPEAHITSFFDQDHVKAVYEKEEIQVDSDAARADVERFLRAEMTRIQKEFSLSPRSQWPLEQDFWKLASASGGLFMFAQTVVKYIGDAEFGDPASQLDDVLKAIDSIPLLDIPREQHPLALLDALYARILSKVPERVMVNTRKILLALVSDSGRAERSQSGGFLAQCNWLGMTCDEAYAAIRHLCSVLSVPKHDEAHETNLRSFHKSFIDYLSDFTRSGFSSDIIPEVQELEDQYTIRILEQAPGGIDCSDTGTYLFHSSGFRIGCLASIPGAGSDIVLSWSADDASNWSDNRTRLEVYKRAFANVVEGVATGHSVFCSEFYIRILISRLWLSYDDYFPYHQLLNLVFEKSSRPEFIESGLLKRVPIKELDFNCMPYYTKLRLRRPSGLLTTKLADLWNPSCQHERAGNWGQGKGIDEDWMTDFHMGIRGCYFCCQRLEEQIKSWKTRSPDYDVTILFTLAEVSFLEFRFVDSDDGVSEWTYWIIFEIEEKQRRKLGSIV